MKEIRLAKGVAAWVDDADFAEFGGHPWRLHANGNACRSGKPFTGLDSVVLLPRMIVGAHSGQTVRPRNNIKLDCRRENLLVIPKPPRRCSQGEDLSAIVLRFVRAFPQQRRFGLPNLRLQLEVARLQSGLTVEGMLARIDGWAAECANIAPWTLEQPAPVRSVPKAEPAPPAILPAASAQRAAFVRSIRADWTPDGTE